MKFVTPISTDNGDLLISLVQGTMSLGSDVTRGHPEATFEGEVLFVHNAFVGSVTVRYATVGCVLPLDSNCQMHRILHD